MGRSVTQVAAPAASPARERPAAGADARGWGLGVSARA